MKIYNPFKVHIVQFENGEYAIRKYSFLYLKYIYKSLSSSYWWSGDSDYFEACITKDLKAIKDKLIYLTDKGTKID